MTAESAQPRKARNVTIPFPVLWVGSGDETSNGEERKRKTLNKEHLEPVKILIEKCPRRYIMFIMIWFHYVCRHTQFAC